MEKIETLETKEKWDVFSAEKTEKASLLDEIQYIGDVVEGTKCWSASVSLCDEWLSDVSEYLGCDEFKTSFFVAVFYIIYFKGMDHASLEAIQNFFGVKQITLIKHKKEILEMKKKGLVSISTGPRRMRRRFDDDEEDSSNFSESCFYISDSIVDAIVAEKELPKPKVVKTAKDFLDRFMKIFKDSKKDSMSSLFDDGFEEVVYLENECSEAVETIKTVSKKIPCLRDRMLFYFVCYDTVETHRGRSILVDRISQIAEDSYEQNELLKELIASEDTESDEDKNILVRENLLDILEAKMAEDTAATATNDGLALMFGKDVDLYKAKVKDTDVLKADQIIEKELFFSGETKEQLSRIENAIEKERFAEIQKRLGEKGMAKGIAALFYGEPGTGKTESVQQLARLTGRDIYHVDISQTKTMWYGESPKLVKKIFKKYKGFCEDAKKEGREIPILLLNEADAVISKRADVDGNTSECEKETNSIQNVILEEMEKLEGIMIATTNLADNMDAAFERRFLFKVEFKKPDAEGRAKIWKSKLKSLSKNDAVWIAGDFDFSGGEIDNIARKVELEEVISGTLPDVGKIREFCKTEKINSGDSCRAIGFAA